MHYVYDVYMEAFCYNPSIKTILARIIEWGRWEESLSENDDVLKANEEFRNDKMATDPGNMFYKPHEPNVGMIKYFVNIFKHLHSDLPHTQVSFTYHVF
ncbi:hypothetical protein SLEP1_g20958 [Rubroshorea leprosula]|uniref:Uncharacterized protein n=1 Tax=Rubroshorea leprosula TaxID=152421 RepID=A0AAV5JGC5_9ROSI|nr:hypothetical protein SLEP1_g20958 [Rubroshorea leprosula]